ncbi:MAG: Ig-like domain-containing protein, partial [Gemmatimonadota bacterium]|nr:Ig-like domain-containing protein [Gemmatimonadota bacterium]
MHAFANVIARATVGLSLIAGLVTCDGANVLGPVGVESLELEWLSDTLLIVESRVVPVIRITKHGSPVEAPRLIYTTDNPEVAEVSSNGDSIYARRIGTAVMTVRMTGSLFPESGQAWQRPVRVVLKELRLDRVAIALTSVGDTATLHAIPLGAGDQIIDVVVEWQSLDSNKVSVVGGRLTARGTGSTDVLAIVGLDTARATVTIEQRLSRFVLSPEAVTLVSLGEQVVINAVGVDNSGAPVPGVTPFWESGDASIARVDETGRVTAIGSGTTTVYAFKGPVRNGALVQVAQRATRVVLPDAAPPIRSINDTLRLTATAYDASGAVVNDPARILWTSLQPGIASVDRGLVRGLAIGTAFIVASLDGAADTVAVEVRNDPSTIVVTPADTTLTFVGQTAQLRATVRNALGGEVVGATVVWSSSDASTVEVDASGRITARGVTGTTRTRITAASGGVASDATVGVTNLPNVIDFVANADTLDAIGDTASPAVQILNENGDPLPRTAVQWESDRPAIATVDVNGTVTARDTGTAYVKAFANNRRDSVLVLVRNLPAAVIATPAVDTLTKAGQQATYTAEVRNSVGAPIANYPTVWRSDNTGVATVSSTGTVTANALGNARIIAEAGTVADTVALVIRNLTVLHVDNASTAVPRIGTRARPFAAINAALADATMGDTIAVHPGNQPYVESVVLGGQLSVIGSDSAYQANGNNPSFLPTISHESGAAAIVVTSGASVLVRNMTVRHVVDGPAIDADGAGVRIENVHVNPGQTFRLGRGFRIANATGAIVADSRINAVVGYGVLLSNVGSGLVSRVRVTGVDSVLGANGEGLRIVGGTGNTIELTAVRATVGPRILLDSTAGARVTDDTLAGRHRLLRVNAASGATVITNNVFTLTQQADDVPSGGSSVDGRAALEIIASGGVTVGNNSFTETGTSAMDAVRMIDARGNGGVSFTTNRFRGGRYHLRSERSTWSLTSSLSENAMRSIVSSETDTITMTSDTLRNGLGRGCVDVRGSSSLSVVDGWFASCTAATADTGMAAITVDGPGAALNVRGTRFTGPNESAIAFNGAALTVQNVSLSGAGTRTVPALRWGSAITATASAAEVTGSLIVDYRALTGVSLDGPSMRVENNRLWRNRRGLEVAQWTTATIANNDFADHEVAALVNVDPGLLATGTNWWGDGRGPRRTANIDAAGDSIVGTVEFGTPRATPYFAGAAATEDSIRIVRGNNQTGPRGTALP